MQWWHAQRLRSKSPQARREAVERLAEHPSVESLRLLAPMLKDPAPEVRKAAIRALGRARESEYLPYLLESLQDSSTEVRVSAVSALREVGDIDATEALVQALKDKDPGVRAQSAKTLERFGWKPRNKEESVVRDAALGHYMDAAKAGLPVLDVLTKTLSEGTPTNKRAAVEALGNMGGEEVVPPLLAALRDDDCTVRVAVLEVLKQVVDTRALQPIMLSLKHTDAGVRTAAATALGFYGPEAVPALAKCLNDKSWSVRKAAVEALGRGKDPALIESLLPRLKDSDHDVRETTCEALGRIRSRAGITALVLTLTDSQTSVRQAAAVALREIDLEWPGAPEALEAVSTLKEALNDREYWVRQAAREALERIESAPKPSPAEPVMDEKLNAAVNVLLALLKTPQRDLRLAAAEALARFPQFHYFLAVAENDEDQWVRQAAEKVLQQPPAASAPQPAGDIWGAAA